MSKSFCGQGDVPAIDHWQELLADSTAVSVGRGELERLRAIEREAKALAEAILGADREIPPGKLSRVLVHGPALLGLLMAVGYMPEYDGPEDTL